MICCVSEVPKTLFQIAHGFRWLANFNTYYYYFIHLQNEGFHLGEKVVFLIEFKTTFTIGLLQFLTSVTEKKGFVQTDLLLLYVFFRVDFKVCTIEIIFVTSYYRNRMHYAFQNMILFNNIDGYVYPLI